MGRLEGKSVLITGAARGIGRAASIAFAEEGAEMVLVDICANVDLCPYPLGTAEQLAETAERCRLHGTRVLALTADVRDQTQVDDAVHRALEQFGRIDVLVNNAGIVAPAGRRGEELSDDEWRLLIDTNLTGTWRVMKATVPSMIRRRSGSVINVASTAGLVGFGFFAGYVSAKHGVVGLTKAMAIDLAPFRIRVNAVCPGLVRDDPDLGGRMLLAVAESLQLPLDRYEEAFKQSHVLHALVEPDDVARVCVFLASDEAVHVTGTAIPVDAGFVAK